MYEPNLLYTALNLNGAKKAYDSHPDLLKSVFSVTVNVMEIV